MHVLASQELGRLFRTLDVAFPGDLDVRCLFEEYFDHDSYDRAFASKLAGLARDRRRTWDLRRSAALMLQHQALLIPAHDLQELGFLLDLLRLKEPDGDEVRRDVLKQGYSTTAFPEFAAELRRKLARHAWLFRRMRGRDTSESALGDFIHHSKRDSKLALARYLVRPEEVVDRIRRQAMLSRGSPSAYVEDVEYLSREVKRSLAALPEFEAEILRRLWASPVVYWVAESTGSEINSLLEYPLGTVVLVVKPPGSELEIELKRAGRRGKYLLGVRFRDEKGYLVANMHRLDGGSSVHFLRHEAAASARFAQLYRLVHGTETRHSKTVSITGVYTMPLDGGEVQLFEYFTRPEVFGDKYSEMRQAMKASIGAFEREWGSWIEDLPGDLGLTVEFLSQIPPAQGVQVGTSSFRVDLLEKYLSAEGPDRYFKDGLGVDFTADDARRFADEILEEVLGVYEPPEAAYEHHERYVEEAFRLEANRRRADACYLSILSELATVWGTVLGLRGFSGGESFVARNLGLRAVWEGGEWTVKIHFMDHDNLQLKWGFAPMETMIGTLADERYLFGTSERFRGRGTVEVLGRLYRAFDELEGAGHALFNRALAAAYRRTRAAVSGDASLRKKFKRSHLERSRNWDRMVASYVALGGGKPELEAWQEKWKQELRNRGYGKKAVSSHMAAFEQFGDLLRRYSFLYTGEDPPVTAVTAELTHRDNAA